MNDDGPRRGRMLLAGAFFLGFAGGAWYIAHLRAQHTQLRAHPAQTHTAAAPAPAADGLVVGPKPTS